MTILQRLKFWNSSVEKVEGFTIDITFLTSSGYEIITQTFHYKLDETIFYSNQELWNMHRELRKAVEDKYREEVNKYCKQQLIDYRKKKIDELEFGQVIKGKHIIKCNWNIDILETKDVTYNQFKEYLKLSDEEYNYQLKEKKWMIHIE